MKVARWRNGNGVGLAFNRSRVQILLGATLHNNLTLGKLFTPTAGWMTYGHLRADYTVLYTGISSGSNARYRVRKAFTFTFTPYVSQSATLLDIEVGCEHVSERSGAETVVRGSSYELTTELQSVTEDG